MKCLVLLLSLSVLVFLPCFVGACDDLDEAALLAFSANLTSAIPLNWTASTDCCSAWEGITCGADDDRVSALSLPSRGLRGPISPRLAALTSLTALDLSLNSFTGSLPIVEILSSLAQLRQLNLSYNRLHGGLPPSSSSAAEVVSSLRTIDLSSNFFNGTVPEYLFAPPLLSFNLSNNSFSGQVPDFCGSSPAIRLFDFSWNRFSGEIPGSTVGRCSALEVIRGGLNKLTGTVPDELYGIATLQEISLPLNNLSGTINTRVVSLTRLRVLELFSNNLTGPIPDAIGRLTGLEKLALHINNLTGPIPASVANLTKLTVLNLRVNSIAGDISKLDFSALKKLATLDLGNNYFTGEIPRSLCLCESLTALRFAGNQLRGEVPPEMSSLQSLTFLSISNNTFTNFAGALSAFKGIKSLTTLIMSKNFFHEDMPEDESIIAADGFQNLKVLSFGGCNISGEIPTWLAKLQKLQVLDLSINMITGKIPGWLGNFPNLFYLDLSVNLLTGGFPKELCSLQALTTGLSRNVTMPYLELPVFVMPNNATNQQYNQLVYLPPAIYLSNNHLTGNIPVEIGQLKLLHILELNNNSFTGSIPDEFSSLTNLERLDLSGNNLTGQIPSSLRVLHFLSFFSVAYNDLHGPVPLGGQFSTFGGSSYDGNPGLCGPPIVQRSCPSPLTPIAHHGSKKASKKLVLGVVIGTCFGIGFLAIVTLALWILSSRRILPRGDSDKIEFDEFSTNDSNFTAATTLPETVKDESIVVMFPINNDVKNLSIVEILKATENFNQANIIGCGGFGLVYKATLSNGTKLAIKKLSGDLGLMEREFKAEVETLSMARHENLVTLEGYCVHDGCRLLIYSYMENGSLDFWLHENPDGPSQLDWPTRLKILRGASLGLAYMHQECEPHIVHRDIKSSNILLDERFEAHVADFGLSRMILPCQTHVSTELVGTLGYIPPEYGQAWVATLRGDMYSFGVVMLEMLTGKRPVEVFRPRVSRELVGWVLQMRSEGKEDEVFDPRLRGKGFEDQMARVLDVACLCINHNPFKRPNIREVVDRLENVGPTT